MINQKVNRARQIQIDADNNLAAQIIKESIALKVPLAGLITNDLGEGSIALPLLSRNHGHMCLGLTDGNGNSVHIHFDTSPGGPLVITYGDCEGTVVVQTGEMVKEGSH